MNNKNRKKVSFHGFQKNKDDEYTYYEMINSKGFVSNVTFEKIDRITFYSYSREDEPLKAIIDFSYFAFPREETSEDWIIREDNVFNLNNFAFEIVEKINSSVNSNDFYYMLDSYYHVIYNDFQNVRHEEYYEIDSDGSGLYTVKYSTVKDIIEKNGVYLSDTAMEYVLMDEKEYDRFIDIAVNEIQSYYHD